MPSSLEDLRAALAGHYEIEREIGQGGMATVYLAHDVKHDRNVAVKVLRPELAAVLGAERFVQEIKTTANLQHPHILPLFDSGEADGFLYYVMPYIEGETLRAKLDRETQLGIEEAVGITTDVADALDYAHRHNVIHRDIKPENILLHDGRPMVADFGIALALSAAAGGRMTETGLSLGTPHYMSPEQATAEKEITARSDVYSLGSVLYEMLTGDPPHTGSSAQQIIMKIVAEEVQPVTELRRTVPPNVAAAIGKSLEKLPADRFTSAQEFASALADAHFRTAVHGAPAAQPGSAPMRIASARLGLPWVLVLMALSATAGWVLRPGGYTATAPVTRFTIPVSGGHEMETFLPNLAVSADGRMLAYFANDTLYKHAFDRADPEPVGETNISRFGGSCCAQFARDGRSILLLAGSLRAVPIAGGAMVDLATRAINEDIVVSSFSSGSGIQLRRAGDTTLVDVTSLDPESNESAHLWPQLLEDSRSVLFTVLGPSMMWHDASVVLQDIESGERTTVVSGGTYGRYVPTDHVVYIRADGTVEAIPFDLDGRRVTGNAFTVEEGVRTGYWAGAGSFAVSDAGTFAFVRGSTWEQHLLTWVDREGRVIGHVGQPVTVEGIALSPDQRYAVTYVASPNADIARFDVTSGAQRRLTFDTTTEDWPIWSPDGQRVAYRKIVSASDYRVMAHSVDDQGDAEQLYGSTSHVAPLAWSPGGSSIVLGTSNDLIVLHLGSQRIDTLSTGFGSVASFSPDGSWLAYTSAETGRFEVYVVSFPDLGGKQQVSQGGGRVPQWSAESGELFYLNEDTLMVATVNTGDGFDFSTPTPLFVRSDLISLDLAFGVSADGQRFLYPAKNPDAAAKEIHVVLNWFEALRAR